VKEARKARSHLLSISACGRATTPIWSCTEAKFNWYYDLDETVMILKGCMVIESDGMPPQRCGARDVVFFCEGAHAKWHIEKYVKKVALLRQTNPVGFGYAFRAINKLKRMSSGSRRSG